MVTFRAKASENIPAHRLVVLAGRDEDQTILVRLANLEEAADFVSTRDIAQGELVDVTLREGLQFWLVEAEHDLPAGSWVYCGTDGMVSGQGTRQGHHKMEAVGINIDPTPAGQVARILRRESFAHGYGLEVNSRLDDLEARASALESRVTSLENRVTALEQGSGGGDEG